MWISYSAVVDEALIEKGYKWKLEQQVDRLVDIPGDHMGQYLILKHGALHILRGYVWDGGSGPAIDTATFMGASLVHDALYQLMREGVIDRKKYRKKADQIMRQISKESGMSWIRRQWIYWAVRIGAGRSSKGSKA